MKNKVEAPLPNATKFFMTTNGRAALQAEFEELKHEERPEIVKTVTWAAGNGDRSENADYQYGKRRLRQIDSRLEWITKRIAKAYVVDPERVTSEKVRFAATVTIVDEEDKQITYTIVGIDEVDVGKGRISWQSPLARALLDKGVDDWVSYKTPKGVQERQIIEIEYKKIA